MNIISSSNLNLWFLRSTKPYLPPSIFQQLIMKKTAFSLNKYQNPLLNNTYGRFVISSSLSSTTTTTQATYHKILERLWEAYLRCRVANIKLFLRILRILNAHLLLNLFAINFYITMKTNMFKCIHTYVHIYVHVRFN